MREEFAVIKLPQHVKLPDNDSISDDSKCASNTVHGYVAVECDTLSIEWWYYLRVVQLVLESEKLD